MSSSRIPRLTPTRVAFIIWIAGLTAVQAQTPNDLIINTQRPYFDLDYASFATINPDTTRLELYIQVRNSELHFVRKGEQFQAQCDITIVLENSSTGFSTGGYHRQKFTARTYEELISKSNAQLVWLDFVVPAGQYRATATVTDFESERTVSRKINLDLPLYSSTSLNISRIEVCNRITPSAPDADLERDFVKNHRKVVPRPNREFGNKDDELGIYFEIYGLEFDINKMEESFLIQYSIQDRQGKIASERTYRVRKPGARASINLNPSIKDLPSGRYELMVSVLDNANRRQANRKTTFFRWSHQNIQTADAALVPLEALKFIAEPSELTQLRETPLGELGEAMRNFWRSKDPTPGTRENEALSHFSYLVSSANNAFGFDQVPGWQTDQGKTFIWNGMPDVIYRNHNPDDTARVEVWVYRTFGEKFIFIDKNGSGNFRLMNPDDVALSQNL